MRGLSRCGRRVRKSSRTPSSLAGRHSAASIRRSAATRSASAGSSPCIRNTTKPWRSPPGGAWLACAAAMRKRIGSGPMRICRRAGAQGLAGCRATRRRPDGRSHHWFWRGQTLSGRTMRRARLGRRAWRSRPTMPWPGESSVFHAPDSDACRRPAPRLASASPRAGAGRMDLSAGGRARTGIARKRAVPPGRGARLQPAAARRRAGAGRSAKTQTL